MYSDFGKKKRKRKEKGKEKESKNQIEKDGLVGIAVLYDIGWKRGSQVSHRLWYSNGALLQAKFYHVKPGASSAGFMTLIKGQ